MLESWNKQIIKPSLRVVSSSLEPPSPPPELTKKEKIFESKKRKMESSPFYKEELIRLRNPTEETKDWLMTYRPFAYDTEYEWSREWQQRTEKIAMLTAGNQLGKSVANIKTCIKWATNYSNFWEKLWKEPPTIFWYFYPSSDIIKTEFDNKWVTYLPNEKFSSCPLVGWRLERKDKIPKELIFNSGVKVMFKSYEQRRVNLQATSVDAIFIDEEPPYQELFSELQVRLRARDGYLRIVFTPLLGQPEFAAAFDEEYTGTEKETFPDAYKRRIELNYCKWFVDKKGKKIKRAWSDQRIKEEEDKYRNQPRLRKVRIQGYFIKESDLMFPSYFPENNNINDFKFPLKWNYFVGVDIGSGGIRNHPAAIVFVAVSEDYKQGTVIACWRGDGEVTSNADIFLQYKRMKNNMKMVLRKEPTACFYDGAVIDFKLLAAREGEAFRPANKRRLEGADTVNTLFKLRMLNLNMKNTEMYKLKEELMSIPCDEPGVKKNYRIRDDLADALRYVCVGIPWDYETMTQRIDLKGRYTKDKEEQLPPQKRSLSCLMRTEDPRLVNDIILKRALGGDQTIKQEYFDIKKDIGFQDDYSSIDWESVSLQHEEMFTEQTWT